MTIARVSDDDEWAEAVRGMSGATFFHTASWATLAGSAFGWQTAKYLIGSGGASVACLVFRTPTGLQSGPIGYGGFLSHRGSQACIEVAAAVRLVERAEGARLVRLVFPPLGETESPSIDGFERTTRSTMIARLAADWEATWSHVITGNARTAARAAEKRGVMLELAHTGADVSGLYAIYEESMARVGALYRTPLPLLEQLVDLGSEHVWLVVARHREAPIGWSMFLRCGTSLFHWISVYRAENRSLLPVHAILADTFRRAVDAGIKIVDLGASHTDEQRFAKSRWGGIETQYSIYER